MNIAILVGGLLIGATYGYIAQRGAFCLNSGFRFVVTRRDFTKVKALGVALAVQMIAVPVLFAAGLAHPTFPAFFPVGAILGGLLFGAAMYWTVGCAAGVWFKSGAGSVGAMVATVGMALGATAFEAGPLRGVRDAIHNLGGAVSFEPTALGVPLWALTVPIGLVLLVLLWRTQSSTAGAWTWRRTGLLLGLVGIVAWPLSMLAGRDFGMAAVPGTVEAVKFVSGNPVSLRGFGGWDILFVFGLPLGAFIAARREGTITASVPNATGLMKALVGGVGLGVGASLAAGCTVGHGLTGIPLLAPGSIVTMVAIFAGSALTGFYTLTRERNAPQVAQPTDCSGVPFPRGAKNLSSSCGDSPAVVKPAPQNNGAATNPGAKTITIIIQNPPYKGDNKAWHGLRFAGASIAEGMNVHVHLLDDGVEVGKRGQKPPDGAVNLEELLKELMEYGLEVNACGLALDGCKLTESEMISGINRGSMKTLASWVNSSDLLVTF
ncbi:MAG: YeeE/YedE family protein [Hydrogenophilales bacterium]|nr:YeeE/YedE family protein [Hydrogenophilales bacterium]